MLNLKNIRTHYKISQTQMASYLDITQVAYLHYEKDQREMPVKLAIKIANTFNYSLDIIYDRYILTKEAIEDHQPSEIHLLKKDDTNLAI